MLIFLLFVPLALSQVTNKPLTIRERMDGSLQKQRESVRKQAGLAKEDTSGTGSAGTGPTAGSTAGSTKEWFTLPWPKDWDIEPVRPLDPASTQPGSAPATATKSSFWQPDCEPVPNSLIDPEIDKTARREGLPADRLREVIRRESSFYPCAVSPKGALGLMQLMPDTARSLGVKDAFDPVENLGAGARYLKQLLDRYSGDWVRALSAYNAGPAAVDEAGGIPPFLETENYVRGILGAK